MFLNYNESCSYIQMFLNYSEIALMYPIPSDVDESELVSKQRGWKQNMKCVSGQKSTKTSRNLTDWEVS